MENKAHELIAIVAMGDDFEIGFNGDLLWRISEDLKRFKQLTYGHPVIMGRKTRNSLPKALPGRTNIVITRNEKYEAPDTLIAHSLEEALEIAGKSEGSEKIYIIGGGQIYKEAFPRFDTLEITHVYDSPEDVDTFFPEVTSKEWELIKKSELKELPNGLVYGFETYHRSEQD